MVRFVIPARKGSKGMPFKNRLLLDKTLSIIPKELLKQAVISTDDEWIAQRTKECGVTLHMRSEKNSTDTASTRDVLFEVAEDLKFNKDDTIVLLYLTFPNRKFSDVERSIKFFNDCKAKSMLCRTQPETHPYLCLFSQGENKGKQIISHDMCRRQEYPECFMVSHYVGVFKASELKSLNRNMYNEKTVFYPIDMPLDVDTKEDYNKLQGEEWKKNKK